MWKTIMFTSYAKMHRWIDKNRGRVQWQEVFVNNAYCIEYRKLRWVY